MDKKYKNSLVLGKFFGLHLGHLYLIDTAIQNSEKVNIMVCYNDTQNLIPGEVRFNALKKIYKHNDNVFIHLVDDGGLPQHDYDCNSLDEFYGYWIPFVYKHVPNIDAVFTSEDYGDDFARYLGVEHFLVDRLREKYKISGTEIRNNPFDNWNLIPNEIKYFFIKRIAIMGPESTGKSTLCKKLSSYFNTNYVEEYGRTVSEEKNNNLDIQDFINISKGRQILEDKYLFKSNKLIFCDTEDITTYIFSKMYCPNNYLEIEEWFNDKIKNNKKYDLYLLMKPDCDSIQDGTRLFLNDRYNHYNIIKNELINRNCNFIEIDGNWEKRYKKSIYIIKSFFNI